MNKKYSCLNGMKNKFFCKNIRIRSFLYLLIFYSLLLIVNCKKVAEPDDFIVPPDSRYKIELENKYGFIDYSGEIVIPPQFYYAEDFQDGQSHVTIYVDAIGAVLDHKSSALYIFPEFKLASNFPKDLALTSDYGPVEILGNSVFKVLHPFNKELPDYSDTVSLSVEGNGIIDIQGNIIQDSKDVVNNVSLKVEFSDNNGSFGYINNSGEDFAIVPQYEEARDFSEGLGLVKVNGKWGYINKNGVYEIEPQYINADPFSEGLACVERDGQYGYINSKNEIMIEFQYNFAASFSEGLAHVMIDRKWGYIDKSNKIIIRLQFEACSYFSEYRAIIRKGAYDGYIDKKGNVVINPQFDFADLFKNGLARVRKDEEWGYINRNGKYVWGPYKPTDYPEAPVEKLEIKDLKGDWHGIVSYNLFAQLSFSDNVYEILFYKDAAKTKNQNGLRGTYTIKNSTIIVKYNESYNTDTGLWESVDLKTKVSEIVINGNTLVMTLDADDDGIFNPYENDSFMSCIKVQE